MKRYKFKDMSAVYDAMISWMEMDYEPVDIDTNNVKTMQRFEADIDRWIESL